MASPTRLEHGAYYILAGEMGGAPTARAFLKDAPQGAGIVAEATAASIEDAIAAVTNELTCRDRTERKSRRETVDGGEAATEAEYRRALQAVSRSEAQEAMLRGHALAGDHGLTAGELAKLAGYKDFSAANLQYGLLGEAVAKYLGLRLPTRRVDGSDVATAALAATGKTRSDGSFVWVMHPELRRALDTD